MVKLQLKFCEMSNKTENYLSIQYTRTFTNCFIPNKILYENILVNKMIVLKLIYS